jgi:4-hydroxybenzoate polyprenyltransferase
MSFSTLLRISRPRFWHYVLGPMLIYFASSWYFESIQSSFSRGGTDRIFALIIMIIVLWYFTLPANLWIYGWNDIADWDTDKFNSKKWSYEAKIDDSKTMKNKLKWNIWWWNIWYLVIWAIIISMLGFMNIMISEYGISEGIYVIKRDIYDIIYLWILYIPFTIVFIIPFFISSYLYSCRPLRAKTKPFIDGIMNVLYIATPFSIIFISYILPSGWDYAVSHITYNFFASLFRCMAMHCYSAIPDIEPDHQAWLTTTAVYLGKQHALIYCGILYMLSALLSFFTLWWFSIIWWIVYLSMIILSYKRQDIFWLYKLFPYINLIIWFCLFWYIILFV